MVRVSSSSQRFESAVRVNGSSRFESAARVSGSSQTLDSATSPTKPKSFISIRSTPLDRWSRPSGGGGGVLRTSVLGPVGVGVCRIGEERRTVPFEFCDPVTDSGEG